VELVRGQLASLKATLSGDSTAKEVRIAADSLDHTLLELEGTLLQVLVTGRGQDDVRWPMRLAEQIDWLAESVQSSDFAPTEAQREVQRLLAQETQAARARFGELFAKDVAGFRDLMRRRNLPDMIM
jgi:hypothetical protein